MKSLFILFAAAFLLMACEPSDENAATKADPSALIGQKWKVVEVDGEAFAADSKAAFTFTDSGRYGGNTGCNSASGAASFEGNKVTLKAGPVTKMACPEPLMAQEQAVITALLAADTWSMDDETLVLHDDAGDAVLRFVRARPETGNE